MATPFPPTRSSTGSARLFPYSVAATFVTIGLPFAAAILVNHVMGFDRVPALLLAVVSIMGVVASSALGTALWMQHPASNEVSFGDLMIWSWARSAQARRKLVRSFERLSEQTETFSPHDRLLTLRAMSEALDRKDPYTFGHSRRVERLAYRTGLALELSLRDLDDLREAASIHDLGKIYIPGEILQKKGSLTDDEYSIIKTHAAMGAEMVAFLGRPELTDAVRFHHERWDGMGYPDGVAGADIPLSARIVGTVDAYDAMTSMRSYRGSLGHKRAVEILVEGKGKQFDATVVTAFLTTLRNPSLIAISIPLLSGPLEALRRVLGWVGRSARTDLATAAGAVGMTVALTGSLAGSAGDAPRPPEENVVVGSQIVGTQLIGYDDDRDMKKGASSNRHKEGMDRKKRDDLGKKSDNVRRGSSKPRGSGSRTGGEQVVAAGAEVLDDDSTNAVGAGTGTTSEGDPDPEASDDPRPGKGKDCKDAGSDSVGGTFHCGD